MSKRYLMWTLFTFVAALFLFTVLPFKWILWISGLLILSLIPIFIVKFSFKRTLISCVVSFLFAAILFSFSEWRINRYQNMLLDQKVMLFGEITDVGTNSAGNLLRYTVKVKEINGDAVSAFDRVYVNLYCREDEAFTPGSLVSGSVKFFDTPIEYGAGREDRILVSGMQEGEELQFENPDKEAFSAILYLFRMKLSELLSFGSESTQGLLRSVCLGNTETLDASLNVSLRRIGLSHITSVSGLHLSFTILLFNFLLMAIGLHYRVRYLIDVFIAIIFTVLVGAPFSCVRACIMIVIMCLAMTFNLFEDSLTSLSVAAFLIAFINPLAVRDLGFMLSVTATFGILVMCAPIENFLFPKKLGNNHRVTWIYRKLTGAFACSIAATIATFPIIAVAFGSVSLIGPFANVLLIYPLQWVFMMGILMLLLGWIPGVGVILGFLCDILYQLIALIAEALGRIPFASVSNINFSGIILLSVFLLALAVGIYDFFVKKRRTTLILLSLYFAFVFCYGVIYDVWHPDSEIEIAFVDVGQGDCTVISRNNTAVIFDYGGSSDKRYNLIKYLRKRNIYAVELLAFTHLHADHTNGLRTLLNNTYVDEIAYPNLDYDSPGQMEALLLENSRVIDSDFEQIVLDDVKITTFADGLKIGAIQTGNERCVCYRVEYGKTSVLITGDMTAEAEIQLMDQMEDVSILKVSHHGSETSTVYPFLKAVSPEIAVISVGENSFGLPDDAVIKRLETVCNVIYKTVEDGNIVFKSDGMKIERLNE